MPAAFQHGKEAALISCLSMLCLLKSFRLPQQRCAVGTDGMASFAVNGIVFEILPQGPCSKNRAARKDMTFGKQAFYNPYPRRDRAG